MTKTEIEIYNCKERFGYTFLQTTNKEMQKVLLAYCEGRSYLWNVFFGHKKDIENQMFFWIPSNKIEKLVEIANKFKK